MKKRILIIDDDSNICRTASRILEGAGYEVVTASDGLEGISRFSEGKFDLVYTDMVMPRMTGLEVLRSIRDQNNDIPVVLITAQPDTDIYNKAHEFGVTDYLLKPLKPDFFIDRTRSILS